MDCNNISSLQENKDGDYLIERIKVQPRLLEVLRDLPVCTGVGVRRDMVGIKDFYTMLLGETAMAAAARY